MEIHAPPELRALCFQLSSISSVDLPSHTPALQRLVLACHVPISSAVESTSKVDNSASSTAYLLVHKLKTHLTTLLYGKTAEGRFAAAVLIKTVVEVGGWEVLRGCEPWVRGLLSMLGKPESAAAKEVCIVVLTKIYCMTHHYQTLLREITSPTLPSFVASCLSVVSSKSSKSVSVPSSLVEAVLRSFALLVPHHSTIFRPFVSQTRLLIRSWLAPTHSSAVFTPSSLKDAARCLAVILHQTTAKNAGGEEWGKSVRALVNGIHLTADQIFRAIIEDWESTAGYVSSSVDVSIEPSGGARSGDDLPRWTGIDAGVDRLNSLIDLLAEYFKHETSTSVSIPIGTIMDMTARILSISAPTLSGSGQGQGQARLNPAIDRDERDRLWAGLPGIHVATLTLICCIEERLDGHFLSLAQATLDQLSWTFSSGKHDLRFRVAAYGLSARLLLHVGKSLTKAQTLKFTPIVRSCCHDLQSHASTSTDSGSLDGGGIVPTGHLKVSTHRLKTPINGIVNFSSGEDLPELTAAVRELLPLLFSHLPQHYLNIALRSQLERGAIVTHNHDAMLASIVHPFVGKNGRVLGSILPYLSREIPQDSRVEILLRPRMPVLPSAVGTVPPDVGRDEDGANDEMDLDDEVVVGVDDLKSYEQRQTLPSFKISERREGTSIDSIASGLYHRLGSPQAPSHIGFGPPTSALQHPSQAALGSVTESRPVFQPETSMPFGESSDSHMPTGVTQLSPTVVTAPSAAYSAITSHDTEQSSDDDESVHLTMVLDTDSEDEE